MRRRRRGTGLRREWGTQIVAKGHDFPGVHVAVVVSADRGFRMPDFRASERTAALVVQLAGRAGRGAVPRRVLVQTWRPDHYVLQHLHDLEAFYDTELRLRPTMRYPPFSRLVLLRFDGVDRQAVLGLAEATAKELRRRAPGAVDRHPRHRARCRKPHRM